jgi:RNA polymerase sigma-70 factor (ECF subfamily)
MSEPTPSDPTDSGLLSRAVRQDADAWLQLVRWIGPSILRWCRRAGLQPADCDDLAQGVLQTVWLRLATFNKDRAGHTFRGWVYVITRNRIIDLLRRDAPSQLPTIDLPAAVEPAEAGDLKRRAIALVLQDIVARHAADVGFKAFYRTAVDGCPAPDVARELGLQPWTVRQHKSRWTRRLRDQLKEQFGELLD